MMDRSDKCPSYSVNISGFASSVVAGRRLGGGAMRNFCKVVFYIFTVRAVCALHFIIFKLNSF